MILICSILFLAFTASAQIQPNVMQELLAASIPKSASVAWTPASLGADLKIWLDNDSLSGADGDRVGYWADSSGNNYYASNSTAATQPYVTNTGTFGTKKSLRFVATRPDSLTFSNALSIARNVGSISVIAVLECSDQGANRTHFGIGRNQANSLRLALIIAANETATIQGRRLDADGSATSDATAGPIGLYPIVIQHDVIWDTSDAYAYTNNVQVIADTSYLTDGVTSDTDSINVTLGGLGTTLPFTGWIAELIVTVPALSGANRTNLFNYLDAKL